MLRNFLFGLTLPLRAAKLILRQKSLIMLSIIPLVISVLIYWLVYERVFGEAQLWLINKSLGLSQAVFGSVAWLAAASRYAVLVSTEIIFWLTAGFLLAPLSNLAALPFNDFLAERSELYSQPELKSVGKQAWSALAKQFLIDFIKNIFSGFLLVLCFFMSWVPVVNIFSQLLGWLLISFQYLSFPQTRRDWGLRRSFIYLIKPSNVPGTLGLGISLSVLFAVPVLSVLVSPIAVVCGTMLFAKQQSQP